MMKVRAIKDHVIGYELEFGEQIVGGIIRLNDDMKIRGIKSRWCKVYAVGPKVDLIKPGQYILVDHARWTKGLKILDEDEGNVIIRRVDYKDVFLVTDEKPGEYKTL